MEQKLVAFDLDGTLLDNQKKPLESTRIAIDQLKKSGHIVTIATGRNRFLTQAIINELAFDYAVMCNGSVAMAHGELLHENTLDQKELEQLFHELSQKEIDLAVVGLDATFRLTTFNEQAMHQAMSSFGALTPSYNQEFFPKHSVYQALAYYDEQTVFDEQSYEKLAFVRWHPKCVDVIPKGGSKAVTLVKMAKLLGIKQENILAFGDGLNDREMLREAGMGIAMGNATDEVKRHADMITDSNTKDGIYNALKKLQLID